MYASEIKRPPSNSRGAVAAVLIYLSAIGAFMALLALTDKGVSPNYFYGAVGLLIVFTIGLRMSLPAHRRAQAEYRAHCDKVVAELADEFGYMVPYRALLDLNHSLVEISEPFPATAIREPGAPLDRPRDTIAASAGVTPDGRIVLFHHESLTTITPLPSKVTYPA